MELLFMVDVAKWVFVGYIIVVIFYFGYVCQDWKDKFCVFIFVKFIVNLFYIVGVNWIMMMDLYVDQIQGFFDIFVDYFKSEVIYIFYF